jgi:hypothetical protein
VKNIILKITAFGSGEALFIPSSFSGEAAFFSQSID